MQIPYGAIFALLYKCHCIHLTDRHHIIGRSDWHKGGLGLSAYTQYPLTYTKCVYIQVYVRPAVTGQWEQGNSEQAGKTHKNARNLLIGYYREKEKTQGNAGRGEDKNTETGWEKCWEGKKSKRWRWITKKDGKKAICQVHTWGNTKRKREGGREGGGERKWRQPKPGGCEQERERSEKHREIEIVGGW